MVSGSIEQNYNYLLLHLVMWPPVPGVNLLLSPVSAQPNTAKLLKEVKGAGLAKLKMQLGRCSFQWYPCWPNNCGPVALAGIIYYYCYNCFNCFVIF